MEHPIIPGFKKNIFRICRIVFSLCILADAIWYMVSFEIRSAYFQHLGLPIPMLYVLMVLFLFFGFRLLFNYDIEMTCLGMIITYCAVGFIVHHPVGEGGIGDYPKHIHGEVNLMQVLQYKGLIGALLIMLGTPDMMKRQKVMHGSKSYAIVLGRAIIALHFMIFTGYFKMIQYSYRSKQITMMGGSPLFHIFFVGSIHILASYYAWFGNSHQKKLGALTLAATNIIMAFLESTSVSASFGVYQMKTEARIHNLIVQAGITTGCILLYSTAEMEAQSYKKEQ